MRNRIVLTDGTSTNLGTGTVSGVPILKVLNIAGSLIPTAFDYISLTYVSSGDGAGEIQTATYKTGGSGGTTIATLTLTYDSSSRISTVTKT